MDLKQLYRRFRAWQRNPHKYEDLSGEMRCCCNCGQEYAGDFCPRCGQNAVYGPITWRSVRQGLLDVWGVGTRSLPYSLWQLLWRPGYLMRDYISGKRQVSFPPVKMLIIVGVAILFIGNGLEPGGIFEEEPVTSTGLMYYIDVAFNWFNRHTEWMVLLLFSFLILPVWSLFREAPAYPHHSLPQGFFIQVFASTQFFLWMMIFYLLDAVFFPRGVNSADYAGLIVFIILVPLMLLVDFKQLFGFGWWGTIWRTALAVPMGLLLLRVLVSFTRVFMGMIESGISSRLWTILLAGADGAAVLWLFMEIVGVINRKEWCEHGWWHVLKRPAWAALALLITTGLCYFVGQNSSIAGLYQAYLNVIRL